MGKELTKKDPITFHFRVQRDGKLQACEGATIVFCPENKMFGISLCGIKDVYCKKTGRAIAEHRAKRDFSQCENRTHHPKRRFAYTQQHNGPLTMEAIRSHARSIACVASLCVHNNVHGSHYVPVLP